MTIKSSESKALTSKTVLIIEDDNYISRVYSKWLLLSGATVEVAHNGALGLRLLQTQTVDIILLDLGMPGLNGYDTLIALKKDLKTKDIPVIVLSNTTMKENRTGFEEIKNMGVKDILRKYETSLSEIVDCISTYFPAEIRT